MFREPKQTYFFYLVKNLLDFSVAVEQRLAVVLCGVFNPNL